MKHKILIIDDDIVTLKILKGYLDAAYEVRTESAGYRFVERMDAYEDVDLILLDIEMPVVNGMQVYSEICKNPKYKNTRVAFLTGASNPNLSRTIAGTGAAGCIVKVAAQDEFLNKVNAILEQKNNDSDIPNILFLNGNLVATKGMKKALLDNSYNVKTVRTAFEAVEVINSFEPDLFVICDDAYGATAREIYKTLSDMLYNKNIQSIVIDGQCFADELLSRVGNALK